MKNTDYLIDEKEKKYIQISKLLFCIMVIFIHSYRLDNINNISNEVYWVENIISKMFCACAVPGFFILSSVLLYKNDFKWKNNIKKKIKSLIIPFLILNTFWILFFYICQNIPQISTYFTGENNIISNWNCLDFINALTGFRGYPILYPLWYIKDLFILNIFAIVIKKIYDRFTIIAILLLISLIIFNVNIPFSLISKESIIFFSIGYIIVKYNIHFKVLNNIKIYYFVVLDIILIFANCFKYNTYLENIIYFMMLVITIILVFKLSIILNNLKHKNFILNISKYTFFIYLFHEMNLTIIIKIFAKYLPNNSIILIIEYLTIPFIILTLCIILAKISEKYLPKIYKLITGYRVL